MGDSVGGSHISTLELYSSLINANVLAIIVLHMDGGPLSKYLHIRNIPFMKLADEAAAHGMSEGDYKRMKIDQNLQARNDLLEAVINKLADMDVDYVFENILNGKEYVSPKARDKEDTFLKRILGL